MSLKKSASFWNRLKNEKYFFFLLPSYFKVIGIVTSLIAISLILLINNIETEYQRIELLNEIFYSFILVGLILVSFSQDKEEDERITNLRYRSFSFSSGLMAIYFVFQPLVILLVDLFFTDLNHEDGIYDGLFIFILFLLVTQLIYFYKFKKEL